VAQIAFVKMLLIKISVVCLAAVICGAVVGVLFSLSYYFLVPDHRLSEVYLSDTYAKMRLRFWIAFVVGAIFDAAWSYRLVRSTAFK